MYFNIYLQETKQNGATNKPLPPILNCHGNVSLLDEINAGVK